MDQAPIGLGNGAKAPTAVATAPTPVAPAPPPPPPSPPSPVPPSPSPGLPSVPGSDMMSVKDTLAKGGPAQFLDVSGGRLNQGDAQLIEKKVVELQGKTGAKVFVVSLPPKIDVESYRPLYTDLGMNGRDLLVVFNGDRRHLHVQAVSKKAGNEILKKTKEQFYKSNAVGLEAMLDEVGTRLGPKGASTTLSPSGNGNNAPGAAAKEGNATLVVLILLVVGVLGWVFVRKRQRDRALEGNLHEALTPAESAVDAADDVIEKRGAASPEVKRLREKTAALRKEIGDVKRMPIGFAAVSRARALRSDARKLRRELASLDEAPKQTSESTAAAKAVGDEGAPPEKGVET